MDPRRWQEIERIYQAAVEVEPERRGALLEEACAGADELRKEVESLLAALSEANEVFKAPAMEVVARELARQPIPSLVGKTLRHYRIKDKIGEGGMGEVFLARDEKLERHVAIKFLPQDMLGDSVARERFLREAKSAAKLDHPHICVVHEAGEFKGVPFIVMEHVEGQSLKQRLARGPLPLEKTMQLAAEIAEALQEAHSRHIIHRDLKPANVMLTRAGHVKVMDFGLAKRLLSSEKSTTEEETLTELTRMGTTMGTLAYMSPEQLQGQPVDHRSDIFSFGALLYETLTRVHPFRKDVGMATAAAILSKDPAPLSQHAPDVPQQLVRLVSEMLAKTPAQRPQSMRQINEQLKGILLELQPRPEEAGVLNLKKLARIFRRPQIAIPADRYWTMEELREDLEAVAEGLKPLKAKRKVRRKILGLNVTFLLPAALVVVFALLFGLNIDSLRDRVFGGKGNAEPAIRLAVLPFVNLSSDPEQEFLADGVTQELITQLGRLHPEGLSVIARISVMRYKKVEKSIDQIGRELEVEYVLEGSARREAERVRITAELIRVADQAQLWADTYERDISGILAVQGQVAQAVAKALAVKLLPSEQARLASARTVNPEAYEAFLKGYALWQKLTMPAVNEAQRWFETAIEKDPSYAPACAGLALVWGVRRQMGIVPYSEAPKIKALALQALALDEDCPEAHEVLAAFLTWSERDWAAAETEWKRALELNPNSAFTHAYYAHFLANMGRAAEALRHSQRAIKLDPFNALYHGLHTVVLYYLRRYDDALAAARDALAIDPKQQIAVSYFQYYYLAKGMHKEQLADQRMRIANDPELIAAFERGLAEGGYEGAQRGIPDVLAARYEKGKFFDAMGVARRYLDGGDKDRAMEFLYKAIADHAQTVPYLGVPEWDALRDDLRFQALLRRIGLPLDQKK